MGVRGSALSTCAARIYMAGVLIFAAWKNEAGRGHSLFEHWPGIVFSRIASLLRLGVPAAGQIVMEVGAFGAATIMAGPSYASRSGCAPNRPQLRGVFLYGSARNFGCRGSSGGSRSRGWRRSPELDELDGWLCASASVSWLALLWFFYSRRMLFLVVYTNQEAVGRHGRTSPCTGGSISDIRWHSDHLHWSSPRTR